MKKLLLIAGLVASLLGVGIYALAQVLDNNGKTNSQDEVTFETASIYNTKQDTTGACCFPNGSCQELDSLSCVSQGGNFEGYDKGCGDVDCGPVCGNGVVESGEECDDGNTNNNDGCKNDCTNNTCGDGVIYTGIEECDDGNIEDGDGCSSTCMEEYCGDGIIQPGEGCDDGNTNNNDGCKNDCTNNTCGDGVIYTGIEECDDGNTEDGDGCSSTCMEEYCGDGIVQPGEGCDDGNAEDGDGCSSTCIEEYCGDGVVQAGLGEECDDGNNEDGDGCSSACLFEEPKPWIYAPNDSSWVRDTIRISAIEYNLSEDIDYALFEYSINGEIWELIGTDSVGDDPWMGEEWMGTWIKNWNTLTVQEGWYYIRVTMENESGKTGQDTISLYVDPSPPVPHIIQPEDNGELSGIIDVIATTEDEDIVKASLEINLIETHSAFSKDLERLKQPDGVTCAPTAAASSLLWLDEKYVDRYEDDRYGDLVPDDMENNPQNLVEDLATKMETRKEGHSTEGMIKKGLNGYLSDYRWDCTISGYQSPVDLVATCIYKKPDEGWFEFYRNELTSEDIIVNIGLQKEGYKERYHSVAGNMVDTGKDGNSTIVGFMDPADLTSIGGPDRGQYMTANMDAEGNITDYKREDGELKYPPDVKIHVVSMIKVSPVLPVFSDTSFALEYNFENANWETSFNTTIVPDGLYSLTVVMTDAAGNIGKDINWSYINNSVPMMPMGVVAISGDGVVELTWDANQENDFSHYLVYGDLTADFEPDLSKQLAIVDGCVYYDSTVTNGETYYYKLSAIDNSGGESEYSNEVEATPGTCLNERGDVTGDGIVNIIDVLALINYILGIDSLDVSGQCRSNCNYDGNNNIIDALAIVNIILGILQECPDGSTCKPIVNRETVAFFESLKSYFSEKDFNKIMTLVKAEMEVPSKFNLNQNYANPFNPVTTIEYSLAKTSTVKLEVYNILGQKVTDLVYAEQGAGQYKIQWDASDMVSGIYFYRLTAGDFSDTKKMLFMK